MIMIFHEENYMELPMTCTRLVRCQIDQHRHMSVKWLVLAFKECGERQTFVNSLEGTQRSDFFFAKISPIH
jgi:hypothetical protein